MGALPYVIILLPRQSEAFVSEVHKEYQQVSRGR